MPADQESLKLARQHLAQLQTQIEEHHRYDVQILQGRLDAANALESTDPAAARAMREAIIKLYSDKPWASHPAVDVRRPIWRPRHQRQTITREFASHANRALGPPLSSP